MKTNHQKWQWERLFYGIGILGSATNGLRQLANCASTLPEESEELKVIAAKLGNMAQVWDDERIKKRSWNMYRIGNKNERR